jgi:hypothetical protein
LASAGIGARTESSLQSARKAANLSACVGLGSLGGVRSRFAMVVDCHMLPAGVSLEFLRGDLRIVHKAVPKRETLMALAGRACKKVHET